MEQRTVSTVIVTYSVLSWISALVLFLSALALTFLSPFAITFFLEQQPAAVPTAFSPVAFQQLATGLAVLVGVISFMFAAFFLALGLGLWQRRPWARYAVLAPCVFWLFSIPIGTLVGGYGIYAFAFNKDIRREFGVLAPGEETVVVSRSSRKKK